MASVTVTIEAGAFIDALAKAIVRAIEQSTPSRSPSLSPPPPPPSSSDDILLTVEQVADLLHMHPEGVSLKARTGAFGGAARKFGNRWLFSRNLLLAMWSDTKPLDPADGLVRRRRGRPRKVTGSGTA